ncbi:uncharacterized protein LOC131891310 [Tigriopus californicus]|uniref:uncharacterized protein LOC131891310 n=1 Tax=Tigriopus californicus TaxID=6832 RepID=UPI0027D9D9B3|nr:uncharacterized protein LOC131891310 [Tigriopus californicus]
MVPEHHLWMCSTPFEAWNLIVRHDNTGSVAWFSPNDHLVGQITDSLYSIVQQISDYKSCKGYYHLRMAWPELGYFNEWWQTSSPLEDSPVVGFEPIALRFPLSFGGLRSDGPLGSQMTATTGPNNELWYALGATEAIALRFPLSFGGLRSDGPLGSQMTATTGPNNELWYALGATEGQVDGAMPGPLNDSGFGIELKHVELYVLKEC